MASEIKPTYLARDGRSFPTAELASAQNKLLDAVSQFKESGKAVQRALSDTAMTADRQPIPWTSRDYFMVVKSRYLCPYVRRIYLYPWACEVETDREESSVTYRWYDSDRKEVTCLKASDLYASEKEATKAAVAFAEESLSQFAAEIEAMKARCAKMK